MASIKRIAPCLWFDRQAEQAAKFYVSIFENSKITKISRYGQAGFETHRRPAGSVMTVAFELDGHPFLALNGGPLFKFSEAISLEVTCDTQREIDFFWKKLTAGGDRKAQQCGWLKDKFGLSWQVTPSMLEDLVSGDATAGSERVMTALLKMKKLNIARLQRAFDGKARGS